MKIIIEKIFIMSKAALIVVLLLLSVSAYSQPRFPAPEFETDYKVPETQVQMPRTFIFEILDLVVFVILLSAMTYFVHKKRSRSGIFIVSIISIIYFGFYKVGCVCPVGSVQNVSMALFQSDYVIPLTTLAFFVIPIIYTIFFGRSFCAGVCVFGAIQELVIYKPISLPAWIRKTLSGLAYLYLAYAVLFAATGADFIICRYDPFIGFFRFSATYKMVIFSVAILITGIFIARPYCRFLCPYGVILSWFSSISKYKTSITPSNCIQCKLCENSCPVDAINMPAKPVEEKNKIGTKRILILLIVIPLVMLICGYISSLLYKPLSSVHPTVKLAEEINWEIKNSTISQSEEAKVFHTTGIPVEKLFVEAATVQNKFFYGSWIVGMFLGFCLVMALLKSSVINTSSDYVPDKSNCVSCGRCFKYCPVQVNEFKKNKS